MAVPAAKVKAICTGAEIALVRASRKPELAQLSAGELKRYAVRARQHFDKWQDLSRGQSRDRRRQTGSSDIDANTRLKAQIFREALDAFEAQLAKVDPGAPHSGKTPRTKAKKKVRAGEHRATRAAVRKGMTIVEKSLNAGAAKKKAAAAAAPAPASPPAKKAAKSATKTAAAKKKAAKRPTKESRSSATGQATLAAATAAQKRQAITAAKKSRLDRSGKSSRVRGHVSARGKRAQARRDAKN